MKGLKGMAVNKVAKPSVIKKEVNQDKLHWRIKHSTDFRDEDDFLETILVDYGVKREDIPIFLNPDFNLIHDPLSMKNMKLAVEIVRHHVLKGSKIVIKVDADTDGFTSSSVIGQFLDQDVETNGNESEFKFILPEAKEHGLTYDMIKNFTQDDIDLIIIPDASMEIADAKLILENFPDVDIVVLDHHLIEVDKKTGDSYTNYCVAVNCTDGEYPNPDLSGVGVVQKFIEAYMNLYPEEVYNYANFKYLDLVSLGISADSMSLTSLENRYYVMEGLKKAYQRNEFLNEIEIRFEDDFKFGRTVINMTWKTAPLINGVIRSGKPKEKEDTFYAMLGEHRDIEYQPRRKHKDDPKPPIEIHSLQWEMAKTCYNVKQRQDTEVRKQFEKIEEKIQKEHLDLNSILFVDGNGILGEKSTVTGLIANKLASKYFRPVVLMKDFTSDVFGGSARDYANSNIENLNAFLSQFGVECKGHEGAFGIKIKKDEVDSIIQKINETMPIESLEVIHDVDWHIPASKMKIEYVSEVAQNYSIWGTNVKEPTFVITDLVINAADINGYGEYNSFIRFNYKGIPFTKKYCKATEFDKMICKQRTTIGKPKYKVRLNLICQFVLNAWEDKVNPEVKILYFDSVKDDEVSAVDEWIEEPTVEKPVEEPPKKKRGRPKKQLLILDDDEPKKVDNVQKSKSENLEKVKMTPLEEDDEEITEEKIPEKIEVRVDKPQKKIYTIEDDFDF